MEEIRDAHTLEQEIMDDARKRAERILGSRQRTMEEVSASWRKRTADRLAELDSAQAARRAQLELQSRTALPLEKTREFLSFAQRSLEESVRNYFLHLSEEQLIAELTRGLVPARAVLGSAEVTVHCTRISANGALRAVSAALPEVRLSGEVVLDPGELRASITVAVESIGATLVSSENRIEQELFGRHRRALIDALLEGKVEP